jgi:hypothetical protein
MALDPQRRGMRQPIEEPPPEEEVVEPGGEDLSRPDEEPAMPPAVGDEEMGITQASPEEQAEMERFVGRAWELIYSDNTFPQIVTMLEGGAEEGNEGDPVGGLAAATEMVVARVAQAADQAGHQVPPDVLYHAGADILEELAEVSRRGKIKDYSQDKDGLERAWLMALDRFRERLTRVGEIDQGSAKADLDRLVAMDQNGTLEKIMRDLAASDEAGQAGNPAAAGGPNAPGDFEPKPKGMRRALKGE